MDILKPELVWIENRCYRKIPIKGSEESQETYFEDDLYPIQPNEHRQEIEDEEDANLPITNEGDEFWIQIFTPEPLIGWVIGKQGKNIKHIAESTRTIIKCPNTRRIFNRNQSAGKESGVDIVIKGEKRAYVAQAYRRIECCIIDGRWKIADHTHFISIPMNNEQIQTGFMRFQEDILKNYKSAVGISKDLFDYPMKLHLTIVMLTLFNPREIEMAKGELKKCRSHILNMLGEKKLKVEVRGVEYMNDAPAEVNVLYGKIRETDGDNSLQLIANRIAEAYANIGLAQKEYDVYDVKLHVTLMKSRKGPNGERIPFDARKILQKYEDYLFGVTTVNEIHISTRYTGNDKKYYTTAASINL